MKKPIINLLSFVLLLLLSGSSCETDNEWGPGLSGTWNCEESSPRFSYRTYKVSMERDENDTSLYRIYNFYNLGLAIETVARLSDTVLTLLPNSSDYYVVGTGHVNRSRTNIYWEYSISGIDINDQYVEAHYYRR